MILSPAAYTAKNTFCHNAVLSAFALIVLMNEPAALIANLRAADDLFHKIL
jgi:hypothetical protein